MKSVMRSSDAIFSMLYADGLYIGKTGFQVKLKLAEIKLKGIYRGAWVAQSVGHPTSAQVMVSWFVSSSPVLGSVLRALSLEPASDSVSPPLSAPPIFMLCLSPSLNNK